MITQERLAEIQARLECATPGPWKQKPNYIASKFGRVVMETGCAQLSKADTYFIANAVEDITALIAEVKRQNSIIAEYECLEGEAAAGRVRGVDL